MLYFHVGLHKTGTTSFQYSCMKNREKLLAVGLDYPDDPDLTLGSGQHLRFARSFKELIPFLDEYKFKTDCDQLISTEEIINAVDATPDDKVYEILSHLQKKFNGMTVLISIREDVSICKSLVQEYAEGCFFRDIYNFLPHYARMINRLFRISLRFDVRCIDINKKPTAISLPSYYISEGTGKQIELPELYAQVSLAKQPLQYFTGPFRTFYAQLHKLDPYNNKINTIYSQDVLKNITINPEYNERLKGELEKLFSDAVEHFFKGNSQFIPNELRALAANNNAHQAD